MDIKTAPATNLNIYSGVWRAAQQIQAWAAMSEQTLARLPWSA